MLTDLNNKPDANAPAEKKTDYSSENEGFSTARPKRPPASKSARAGEISGVRDAEVRF
jgi:hypothetical protein